MVRTTTHRTSRKLLERVAGRVPSPESQFAARLASVPHLNRLGVLVLALACGGCHLDASNKLACDSQDDCLAGYVCTAHECISEKEHGSDATLLAPTEVAGSFDPSSLEFRLTWKDNSEDETGFEIEQKYLNPSSTSEPQIESLCTMQSSVRAATYRFVREGTYVFRVRAVRGSDYSAYSSEHVHIATEAELFPRDRDKVPGTPQGHYSYVESADEFASPELRWDEVDFRGDAACLTGYRVYRGQASFGLWTLRKVLPTSVRFYPKDDDGFMYDYAVAAYNSFGESDYWTYVKDDAL